VHLLRGAFGLFWLARTISLTGSAVTSVALPILVYGATGSATLTSLLTAIATAPYLLFGLLSGAVADRVDRRRLLIGCDLVSAVAIAAIPLTAIAGFRSLAVVYVSLAVVSSAIVWFDAASFGFVPSLVGRDRIVSANSVIWSSSGTVSALVPGVAGGLVALLGARNTIALNALCFLLSALLISRIATARGERPAGRPADTRPVQRTLADIREGLVFLWTHPVVRTLTIVGMGNAITGGAVLGAIVVYAVRGLGLPSSGAQIGLLFAASGTGALGASLALPHLVRLASATWVLLGALAINVLTLEALAVSPALAASVPLLVLWSAAYTTVIITSVSIRQQLVPDALMSRVNATARMLAVGLGVLAGAGLGGVLADQLSIRPALAVFAVPIGLSSGAGLPALLRHVRRRAFPESA
jgi:MFS family permease